MRHDHSLLARSTLLSVPDASAAGDVRRFAQDAAAGLGFDETRTGQAAIVATELVTNLARHAGGGEIVVRTDKNAGHGYLELLALDRGPGMRDVTRCLEDGFSTAGGPGNGLGAIRRLSDEFDIHSLPGVGTAVLARFTAAKREPSPFRFGALSLPYPGETACGDAWLVGRGPDRWTVAVIDGLGHGVDAALAAAEAVRTLSANDGRGPVNALELGHLALRPTRGAAVAMAELDVASRRIHYAGVGNIVGATAAEGTLKRLVSFDGTLGHEAPKIQDFAYVLEPGQALIMHSDGLRSQWKLDRYPGILSRDPFLVAGVLYRDNFKGNDDATVVVLREEPR